jgi:colanic acid biosynthesis glycosyl transferase WcaI
LFGAKTLLHVQDFEVEAGFATGQMAASSRVSKFAIRFGDAIIRLHDRVTSISPAMVRKLNSKRPRRSDAYQLRNWADIAQVVPMRSSPYRERWTITTPHVLLYSGSIARKQGLEMLVEVARLLEARDDITFVICGNGPYRTELEQKMIGLTNIQFHDLQPRENLGALLNLATIHLLPQKRDAADLVLPSKLTNMLASGRPVIAGAATGTGLAEEIQGCGIAAEPENAMAMAEAIVTLLDNPELHIRLGTAARLRAEAVWAQQPIIAQFLAWLGAQSVNPTR